MSGDSGGNVIDASQIFAGVARPSVATVAGGGDGPHDPGMEARVARLEEDFRELRKDIRGLVENVRQFREDITHRITAAKEEVVERISAVETDLGARISTVEKDLGAKISNVEKDVARLDGRVSQLPTTWVLLTALLGFAISVAALVFAIARAVIKV